MNFQELLIYWKVIKERLWLIAILMVVTLGAMLAVFLLSPPVYRATASFQVTAPLPAEVSLFSEFKTPSSVDQLARTRGNFIAVLQSDYVVNQVIAEIGLDMEVEEFIEQVLIEPDESSSFVKLRVTAAEPKLATAIANTLLDRATQYFGELSAGSVTANKEFIEEQIEETEASLSEAHAALIQFQIENGMGTSDSRVRSQEDLITVLKGSRDRAFAEGDEIEAAAYDKIIAARERELQELIQLAAEYESLYETVDRIQDVYAILLSKETEAKLKENEILSARFILVIPAREPSHPLPRINFKILLLGGIVSLVLGIMVAFGLEYSERTRRVGKRAYEA
ncbi:MAG TPA: hypothetical protein EYP49_11075 [Anaerolineae bacterium]|nr:hypothetical protein [Anaerolineae bacterium]